MEALINIIIWVCIIVSFVRKLNSKKKKGEQNGSSSSGRNQTETYSAGRNMSGTGTRPGRMDMGKGTPKPNVPRNQQKQKDLSTTDYLQRKARADEQEHRKEKYLEMQRAKRETGGIPAAVRLYEGDSVPDGMTRVRCSYCAADNLIPEGSRQRYTCYFCREELSKL